MLKTLAKIMALVVGMAMLGAGGLCTTLYVVLQPRGEMVWPLFGLSVVTLVLGGLTTRAMMRSFRADRERDQVLQQAAVQDKGAGLPNSTEDGP